MNKWRRRLFITSAIVLCTLIPGVRANPNHLEPIPFSDDTGYRHAVFASLIGAAPASLWMIERPSFSAEYAVILRREVEYDPNDTRPTPLRRVTREQWFVVRVIAKDQIWRWKHADNNRLVLDIRPTEDVEIHCTPVTKDFAQTLEQAWWSVLQLTRAPKESYRFLNGTTLQFGCGYLSGEIWSPKSGLPAQLAELGRNLGTLALSGEKVNGRLLGECAYLARKIRKEAEEEQTKVFGRRMPAY